MSSQCPSSPVILRMRGVCACAPVCSYVCLRVYTVSSNQSPNKSCDFRVFCFAYHVLDKVLGRSDKGDRHYISFDLGSRGNYIVSFQ